MSSRLLLLVVFALMCLQSGVAKADYPERSIRLLLAGPAGGSVDLVARILADRLRVALGQAVVVENRAGAAGAIAAQAVASADSDGYTVLMTTSALAIAPWMSPSSFDPIKDLAAVTRVAVASYVLVVRQDLPVSTLDDFVAMAKAQPNLLTCSTYGIGSPPHLALELVKRAGNLGIVHAPYRAFGQALPDLMSGLLACAMEVPINAEQSVRSGMVRAIAVTSPKPLAMFPGATPLSDRFPGVVVEGWQGIFVPAGTPQPIVHRLNAEIVKIIQDPEIGRRLGELGFNPVGDTSEHASIVVKRDYERFGDVIRSLNLKQE